MTISIASYQRRESLMRLLRALDEQFASSDKLRRDVEIVVVLDGSTDGSQAAVEGRPWCVPVRVHWQPNGGLASARNVGLAAAAGRIVWFLDDDLIPSPGLIARHRYAHRSDDPSIIVGPCRIPPDVPAPTALVAWWDDFYAELEAMKIIDRFDRFTTANASAPADLLSSVGGFDSGFVEYGMEDYELGARLLGAGITVRFDGDAVAWHPDIPPPSVLIRRQYGIGLNAARIAVLHPDTVDTLFPITTRASRKYRACISVLRVSLFRSPRALMLISRMAYLFHRLAMSFDHRVARRGEMLSRAAARAAGTAAGDPSGEMISRLFGYSTRPRRD